jgi:uncharacterized protein (TIGR04255 family)
MKSSATPARGADNPAMPEEVPPTKNQSDYAKGVLPELAKPPIVEASIEVHAKVQTQWAQAQLEKQIKAALPHYSQWLAFEKGAFQATLVQAPNPSGSEQPAATATMNAAFKPEGWDGLQGQSADGLDIVRVQQDRLTVHRLAPYLKWEHLVEMLRAALTSLQPILQHGTVVKVGTRFFNRQAAPLGDQWVLPYFPGISYLPGLIHGHFVCDNSVTVRGYPVLAQIVRTSEPPVTAPDGTMLPLIILIAAEYVGPISGEPSSLAAALATLHDVKNKVFRGGVSDEFLALCR